MYWRCAEFVEQIRQVSGFVNWGGFDVYLVAAHPLQKRQRVRHPQKQRHRRRKCQACARPTPTALDRDAIDPGVSDAKCVAPTALGRFLYVYLAAAHPLQRRQRVRHPQKQIPRIKAKAYPGASTEFMPRLRRLPACCVAALQRLQPRTLCKTGKECGTLRNKSNGREQGADFARGWVMFATLVELGNYPRCVCF